MKYLTLFILLFSFSAFAKPVSDLACPEPSFYQITEDGYIQPWMPTLEDLEEVLPVMGQCFEVTGLSCVQDVIRFPNGRFHISCWDPEEPR